MGSGEKIMNLRKRLNLTQRQVALAVGVTDQTVSNWEKGVYKPRLTPAQTLALCQILRCSLEELVAVTSDDESSVATSS
ncbi:transcriptional regulator [cyanobacterium TDX16]|nr:transcriptional regulator [cyanobacterium TDX16]